MPVTYRRIYQNDNGIWWLEFECDGRRLYFSLRTRLEAVAQEKAARWRDLVEGNDGNQPCPTCHGTGEVLRDSLPVSGVMPGDPVHRVSVYEPCPTCGGSGGA